jgi:hypothetical protein
LPRLIVYHPVASIIIGIAIFAFSLYSNHRDRN